MAQLFALCSLFFLFSLAEALGAPNPDAADYYERLGVSRSATLDEIKHAWREAVKAFHTDTHESQDRVPIQRINEAYDTLKDSQKRAQYDLRNTGSARGFAGSSAAGSASGSSSGTSSGASTGKSWAKRAQEFLDSGPYAEYRNAWAGDLYDLARKVQNSYQYDALRVLAAYRLRAGGKKILSANWELDRLILSMRNSHQVGLVQDYFNYTMNSSIFDELFSGYDDSFDMRNGRIKLMGKYVDLIEKTENEFQAKLASLVLKQPVQGDLSPYMAAFPGIRTSSAYDVAKELVENNQPGVLKAYAAELAEVQNEVDRVRVQNLIKKEGEFRAIARKLLLDRGFSPNEVSQKSLFDVADRLRSETSLNAFRHVLNQASGDGLADLLKLTEEIRSPLQLKAFEAAIQSVHFPGLEAKRYVRDFRNAVLELRTEDQLTALKTLFNDRFGSGMTSQFKQALITAALGVKNQQEVRGFCAVVGGYLRGVSDYHSVYPMEGAQVMEFLSKLHSINNEWAVSALESVGKFIEYRFRRDKHFPEQAFSYAFKIQNQAQFAAFESLLSSNIDAPQVWAHLLSKPEEIVELVKDLRVTNPKLLAVALKAESRKPIENLARIDWHVRNSDEYLSWIDPANAASVSRLKFEEGKYRQELLARDDVKKLLEALHDEGLSSKQAAERILERRMDPAFEVLPLLGERARGEISNELSQGIEAYWKKRYSLIGRCVFSLIGKHLRQN